MLQKQDTRLVTLALLCAFAAAEQPAAALLKSNSLLAQSSSPTALPTPTSVKSVTKLRIASSSSMEKINATLKQRFEQQFPGTEINIGYGETNAAIRAVREEQADIAAIGRPLTEREKERGLIELPVSRNKIAIVVGANNPFTGSLTDQQFAKIFRGEIQNWSAVGGAPRSIRVIDGPETSDIRQTLRNYPVFQGTRFDTGANAVKLSEDSTQATIRELGTDGIGIAIADDVLNQPGVKVLAMHKTTPDDPKYPFSQRLFYVYKKTNTSGVLRNFLGYVKTPQGESAIAQAKTPLIIAATPAPVPPPPSVATPVPVAATPTPVPPPTPATTASPQRTVLPDSAAEASASNDISNAGQQWVWWLWTLGLLIFLLWEWQKNQRSQPQSNQHLSLSNLALLDPRDPQPSEQPHRSQPHLTTGKTPVKPTSRVEEQEDSSSPASQIEDNSSTASSPSVAAAIATGTVIAASGLVAGSKILANGDVSPSEPATEDRSSHTASEPPSAASDTETETTTAGTLSTPETRPRTAEIAQERALSTSVNTEKPPETTVVVTPGEASATSGTEIPAKTDTQPIVQEDSFSIGSESIEETILTDGTIWLTSTAAQNAIATDTAILSDQSAKASDREESEAAKFDPEENQNPDSSTAAGDESRIVLLSREPEWAYAYWNIPNEEKDKLRQQGGAKLALRFYDVTDIDLNTQQPQSIQQYDCDENSRDGYLGVPRRDRDYMLEIGYVAESDRWLMLARSAVVRIPPASAEAQQLADVEFEALRLLSPSPISPEILSSSAGRLGVTNLIETDQSANKTRTRKFRLVADAELSIYGETESDATVTIDGRLIALDPNGTFRYQILFPDGESESTITAVASDGEIYSLQIKFTRQTLTDSA